MSENNNKSHSEKLISVFTSDYIEKLFYFCLKKTGSRQDAEDLASDISLNILSELKKGVIPDKFSAWVWKIARNRYSYWANKKHIKNKFIYEFVFDDDIDIIEDGENFESALVHGEDLKLLRRELSFISKDYRDIIVAFYIDDLKIKTIAQTLDLPENTVLSKLHRSRKILKEGMNMAREFGIRSYKPENVNFMASGNQPSGLPWKVVQRQLPKNILLQANNNPSTIEELAVEIGIAMPYMEEEVKILTDAQLLKEVNGKYITNFFIADKECQLEIHNTQRMQSKERSKILDEIITDKMPEIRKLGVIDDTISDNNFKWILVTRILDSIIDSKYNISATFKRKDGGNWGFTGLEQHNLISENTSMSQDGNGGNISVIVKYDYKGYKIGANIDRPLGNHADLLADIITNKRNINSFTESEKPLWDHIKHFTRIDGKGNIILDIALFKDDTMKKIFVIIKSHPKYSQLENMIYSLFDEIEEILKKYSNPVLHEQLSYYVSSFMWAIRVMTINDEVDAGRLIVPENPEKSTAGIYLEIT